MTIRCKACVAWARSRFAVTTTVWDEAFNENNSSLGTTTEVSESFALVSMERAQAERS
jgi:hypothetical protein